MLPGLRHFYWLFTLTLLLMIESASAQRSPRRIYGSFTDDYGIEYEISHNIWQQGNTSYEILNWNRRDGVMLARTTPDSTGDTIKYMRIDLVKLKNMKPYKWGYCYTVYDAETEQEAREAAAADKAHPKSGCNGYPFSRMKRIKKPFY